MLQILPARVGQAFRRLRSGLAGLTINGPGLEASNSIKLRSPTFRSGSKIPRKYTADGLGISPPLSWTGVPPGTKTLVLVIEDSDSLTPHPLVHAIAWGLRAGRLPEAALSDPAKNGRGIHLGRNSFLCTGYLPPDPPPGHGPHRYWFQLFALDRELGDSLSVGRSKLVAAMRDHVLSKGLILACYDRPDRNR